MDDPEIFLISLDRLVARPTAIVDEAKITRFVQYLREGYDLDAITVMPEQRQTTRTLASDRTQERLVGKHLVIGVAWSCSGPLQVRFGAKQTSTGRQNRLGRSK